MAKATLPTNYRDDILNVSTEGKRKYRMNYNNDGTVSFVDVTPYDQEGSDYGAGDINATNQAVNESFDKNKLIRDMDAINALTQEGYAPDALALKDVNDSLQTLQDIVYNQLYPDGYPLIPTLSANTSNVLTSKGDSTAYLAFDNNADTYCDKMYNNDYIGYDFLDMVEINKIIITVNSWSGSPMATGFILQSSEDNATWDNLHTYSESITKDTVEIGDLNIKARYIRILSTFTGNTAYGLSVNSLQCYRKLN